MAYPQPVQPVPASLPYDAGGSFESRKVSLLQWILHDHSMLGLCFAKDAPPQIAAGPCCVGSEQLTVRHRVFVFLFVLAATLTVVITVSMGLHSAAWGLFMSVLVVMPLTCVAKAHISPASRRLGACLPTELWVRLRAEELLLSGWFLSSIIVLGAARPAEGGLSAGEAFGVAVGSFALQMVMEVVSLAWCYLYCRCCCPCCVPTRANSDLRNPLSPTPPFPPPFPPHQPATTAPLPPAGATRSMSVEAVAVGLRAEQSSEVRLSEVRAAEVWAAAAASPVEARRVGSVDAGTLDLPVAMQVALPVAMQVALPVAAAVVDMPTAEHV